MELELAQRKSVSRSASSTPPASQLDIEIAAYDRVIGPREEALKEMKRRRKSLVSLRTMLQLRADPDLEAKRVAICKAKYTDPAACAALQTRAEAARQRLGIALPKMTEAQTREYRRLRAKKISRDDALKLMGLAP